MSDSHGPIVAIDFDATISDHRYPEIGAPVPLALHVIRTLIQMRWRVILWTMRSGKELQEAVDWCREHGIEFWAVNQNPEQAGWSKSPKAYAFYYVDDAAIGCPLVRIPGFARPAVDWSRVGPMLLEREYGPGTRVCVLPEANDGHVVPVVVGRSAGDRADVPAVQDPADGGGVGRPGVPARKPRGARK